MFKTQPWDNVENQVRREKKSFALSYKLFYTMLYTVVNTDCFSVIDIYVKIYYIEILAKNGQI